MLTSRTETGKKPPSEAKKKSPAENMFRAPGERQRHSLYSFFELSKELDASLDVYGFADRALFNFMGNLGTPRAVLWLLPRGLDEPPVLIRAFGVMEVTASAIGQACIEPLVGRFSRKERIVLSSDIEQILDAKTQQHILDSKLNLFAPLLAPGALIGMVALGRKVGGETYDPFELEVFQASLDLLAVAIVNADLFEALQENNRKLHNANERLHELDRLKTEFVNNMHHELRTPLTVMHSYVDSLLEEVPEGTQEHEHLEVVMAQTNKLKKMVLDLLDFSGLNVNKIGVELASVDIGQLVQWYYEARRRGVALDLRELRLEVEPSLPKVLCDPKRVEQILETLVDNAVKFTSQGTHVDLVARTVSGGVCIDVRDNGKGIPAEQLHTLFEPFRQVDGSKTRATGGLGLGLPLARQLAEAMRGRLEVESTVGVGTTFTLTLPQAQR